MDDRPDDVEQELAAAAEALRELDVTERRHAELQERIDEKRARLDTFRADHAEELRDVERLERLSLSRLLARLRGTYADSLERERAEADTARYRVREAEARLDALQREQDRVAARLRELGGAREEFAAALAAKERRLSDSGDPRGAQLMELAEERGSLTGELHEIHEARHAADQADRALAEVEEKLGSASSWSTYDTFLSGGMVSGWMKHSRLDEAAEAAARAEDHMAALRTELADVEDAELLAQHLSVDAMTKFMDVWVDNFFADLAVHDRIKKAQEGVTQAQALVRDVREMLDRREGEARARLEQLDEQRRRLLT